MESDKYLNTPVGYARVNREPLDKYEVFSSMYNIVHYLKNGPCYDGQHIKLVHDKSRVQKFIVRQTSSNKYILDFDFNGIEPNIITYEGSKWLLVYYKNGNATFNADSAKYNVDNPFAFSILGDLDLFWNSSNKLVFLLRKISHASGVTRSVSDHRFEQPFNPLTMKNANGATVSASGTKISGSFTYISGSCPINTNTSDSAYRICPTSSDANIIKLYVNVDTYLS